MRQDYAEPPGPCHCRRLDKGEELKTTLIRVYAIKMLNLISLFFTVRRLSSKDTTGCVEDTVGNLFRRMIITDGLVYCVIQLAMYFYVTKSALSLGGALPPQPFQQQPC